MAYRIAAYSVERRRCASAIVILSDGFVGQHAAPTFQASSYDSPSGDDAGSLKGRSFLPITAIMTPVLVNKWGNGACPVST